MLTAGRCAQLEQSKGELEHLQGQLQGARAQTVEAEQRLLRALTSAPSSASPPSAEGSPSARPAHMTYMTDVIAQELQAQAAQVALLRSQLHESEAAAAQHKQDVQSAREELDSARSVQEQLLIAVDQERVEREKTTAELNAALSHTARMQALGDAALEETGTVSEQVFALQEVLLDKDQLIGPPPPPPPPLLAHCCDICCCDICCRGTCTCTLKRGSALGCFRARPRCSFAQDQRLTRERFTGGHGGHGGPGIRRLGARTTAARARTRRHAARARAHKRRA